MTYRRHKAMRFDQLLWITEKPRTNLALVFSLISTSKPEGQGLYACISSRITTVIHVVSNHQGDYNWFNEPSAVSQYKLLILRHAWLNLWDKHMTTGRINQVTIVSCELVTRRWRLPKKTRNYQINGVFVSCTRVLQLFSTSEGSQTLR
jgi:hypothetical protein